MSCSIVNAKFAYLLSLCPNFIDSTMKMMINDHSNVATRHNFSVFVVLKHNPQTQQAQQAQQAGEFKIDSAFYKFADSSDLILGQLLQRFNNDVLGERINDIYMNARRSFEPDISGMIALCSIAALREIYDTQYIFVPIIIDYNKEGHRGMVHQTGLIITRDKVLYYEPYGCYKKYGLDYGKAVCKLFGDLFGKCETYHKNFGLPFGIQQKILNHNNDDSSFEENYSQLLAKIQEVIPNFSVVEIESDDKTFKIVKLVGELMNSMRGNDDVCLKDLLTTAMTYYCSYNSKTCVSITLVEMNKFFAMTNPEIQLVEYYEQFNDPNVKLFSEIGALFDKFKEKNKLKKILSESLDLQKTCMMIT